MQTNKTKKLCYRKDDRAMRPTQLDTPVGTHKRPIWDAMWDPLGIPSGLPPVFVSGDPPGSRRDNPFGPHGSLEFTTCTPCGSHVVPTWIPWVYHIIPHVPHMVPMWIPHHPPSTPCGTHVYPLSLPHHPQCTPYGTHMDPTSSPIYPMWYPRVSLESTTVIIPLYPIWFQPVSLKLTTSSPYIPLNSHAIRKWMGWDRAVGMTVDCAL